MLFCASGSSLQIIIGDFVGIKVEPEDHDMALPDNRDADETCSVKREKQCEDIQSSTDEIVIKHEPLNDLVSIS